MLGCYHFKSNYIEYYDGRILTCLIIKLIKIHFSKIRSKEIKRILLKM